jgi:hypothetical protein
MSWILQCHSPTRNFIAWDETPMNARDGRGTISLEGNKWISRNGFGEVYDIH